MSSGQHTAFLEHNHLVLHCSISLHFKPIGARCVFFAYVCVGARARACPHGVAIKRSESASTVVSPTLSRVSVGQSIDHTVLGAARRWREKRRVLPEIRENSDRLERRADAPSGMRSWRRLAARRALRLSFLALPSRCDPGCITCPLLSFPPLARSLARSLFLTPAPPPCPPPRRRRFAGHGGGETALWWENCGGARCCVGCGKAF